MIFYKKSKSLIHEKCIDCLNVKTEYSNLASKSPVSKEFVNVPMETAHVTDIPVTVPRECKQRKQVEDGTFIAIENRKIPPAQMKRASFH